MLIFLFFAERGRHKYKHKLLPISVIPGRQRDKPLCARGALLHGGQLRTAARFLCSCLLLTRICCAGVSGVAAKKPTMGCDLRRLCLFHLLCCNSFSNGDENEMMVRDSWIVHSAWHDLELSIFFSPFIIIIILLCMCVYLRIWTSSNERFMEKESAKISNFTIYNRKSNLLFEIIMYALWYALKVKHTNSCL